MMKRNLLVAHGGGPTSVINASLYGVIKAAMASDQIGQIYGAFHGIEGVLREQFIDLGAQDRETIELLPFTPSSAIGSCRYKVSGEDHRSIVEVLKKYEIGYFFYNGGNDSMDTCEKVDALVRKEGLDIRVIGIPKTIDNDLCETDHCPGYASACRYIMNQTRDLWMEVQAMPLYVTVMETMGRNAGWLAAATCMAELGGEQCSKLIYLPEEPFVWDDFLASVEKELGRRKELLICVSEGLVDAQGESIADLGLTDDFGHKLPGGVAQALASRIMQDLGVKARAEKPGFVGRSSFMMQSSVDREEAAAVGRYAVEQALQGVSGKMVTIVRKSGNPYSWEPGLADLSKVSNYERKFPKEWIVDGCGISDEFKNYVSPLLGEALPPYAKLRHDLKYRG